MKLITDVPCLWRNADPKECRRYLKEGEIFPERFALHYDEEYKPFVLVYKPDPRVRIVPIYDCLHDDVEFGQSYKHYHMDTRYCSLRKEDKPQYILHTDPRPLPENYEGIIYMDLYLDISVEPYPTSNKLIPQYTGTKLNCKTCPHRGYNLKDILPDEDGVITCPLHGTRIDNETLIVL